MMRSQSTMKGESVLVASTDGSCYTAVENGAEAESRMGAGW